MIIDKVADQNTRRTPLATQTEALKKGFDPAMFLVQTDVN